MTIDTHTAQVEWLRFDYDITTTQAAIRSTPLPGRLADRLELGV
jgi:hypothetical protein